MYLWPARMHSSVHLPTAFLTSGIHPIFSSTAHNIELILQVELPLITSAFKMSGYTPAQVVSKIILLGEIFCLEYMKRVSGERSGWNILPGVFEEIC